MLGRAAWRRVTHSQGTYLAWIDVRAKGWADPVAQFEAGGVGLSDGRDFGLSGFVRLNFGCPPAQLEERWRAWRRCASRTEFYVLTQMKHALD